MFIEHFLSQGGRKGVRARLPGQGSWVLNTVSPSHPGADPVLTHSHPYFGPSTGPPVAPGNFRIEACQAQGIGSGVLAGDTSCPRG